jgi:hypothetical protein
MIFPVAAATYIPDQYRLLEFTVAKDYVAATSAAHTNKKGSKGSTQIRK